MTTWTKTVIVSIKCIKLIAKGMKGHNGILDISGLRGIMVGGIKF
jgi:hypothetical protein